MKGVMPPINTPDNVFRDGNPATGTQGDIVPALWLNNVQGATRNTQQELISVLTEAGIEVDENMNDQLLQAILQLTSTRSIPVGIPQPWPTNTAPSGWLKCNGATFDKAKFPLLAIAYPSGKLPDLRGEFIRGWDDGRGVDSGRVLLAAQTDLIKNHSHSTYRASSSQAGQDFDAFLSWNKIVGNRYPSNDAAVGNDVWAGSETRPRNIAFNYIVRGA